MCFRPPTAERKENKCPKCETVNLPEADVCINCGEKLLKLPPPPGVSQTGPGATPPPGAPTGVTPPKAPPAPPKAPPAPPKKPGE